MIDRVKFGKIRISWIVENLGVEFAVPIPAQWRRVMITSSSKKFVYVIMVAIFSVCTVELAIAEQKVYADPTDLSGVKKGSELYTQHCAVCHGANLEGEPNWTKRKISGALPAPPHDPSGHTWHHSDDVLLKLTKYGPRFFAGLAYVTDMPAYQDILSDEEILMIIAFIKSTWPPEILEAQQRMAQ